MTLTGSFSGSSGGPFVELCFLTTAYIAPLTLMCSNLSLSFSCSFSNSELWLIELCRRRDFASRTPSGWGSLGFSLTTTSEPVLVFFWAIFRFSLAVAVVSNFCRGIGGGLSVSSPLGVSFSGIEDWWCISATALCLLYGIGGCGPTGTDFEGDRGGW